MLGQTVSDEDGLFEVQGWETEITDIDPKLNIYHNCEDEQHVSPWRGSSSNEKILRLFYVYVLLIIMNINN